MFISDAKYRLDKFIDFTFVYLTQICAIAILVLLGTIVVGIAYEAWPAIKSYGLQFLVTSHWSPVRNREEYGVLTMVYGTAISTLIALIIALPLGLGTAIFLSECFIPEPIQVTLTFWVELLAAVPSVVYGLWGIFVLIPWMKSIGNWLHDYWGWLPLFNTVPIGPGLLPAGVILAIMIVPMITTTARDSLIALPLDLREAAFALGATRWETILYILIPSAFSGICGGTLLALGRAVGETMAVTMVIGNSNQFNISLLAPGNTIASLLANQFAEAQDMQVSALMYAGLILIILTFGINILAAWIIDRIKYKYHSSSEF